MTVFTWRIRLDKKSRLVVPLEVRRSLGISDSVVVVLEKASASLRPSGDGPGIAVSRNCFEVDGQGSVTAARRTVDPAERVRLPPLAPSKR